MNKLIWALAVIPFFGSAVAQSPTNTCASQLGEDAKFQSLFKKAPFDISKGQPLEVLGNQSKATLSDKAALEIFVTELDRCWALGADWRKQNYPASINGYSNSYQSFLRLAIADLYAGKLTFGDFAKARDKAQTEFLNKVNMEVGQIQAQRAGEKQQQEQQSSAAALRSAERAEEQRRYEEQRLFAEQEAMRVAESRRQEAIRSFYESNKPQPLPIIQLPQRRTTDCSTLGNYTTCTTR